MCSVCVFVCTSVRITLVFNRQSYIYIGETATTFFSNAHVQLLDIPRLPAAATAAATHSIFNATKNNMSWNFHFDLATECGLKDRKKVNCNVFPTIDLNLFSFFSVLACIYEQINISKLMDNFDNDWLIQSFIKSEEIGFYRERKKYQNIECLHSAQLRVFVLW